MIYIDDSEPEGVLEPAFPPRDVTIQRNIDANQLYDILGEVGRGKFGTVYKCQEKSSGLKLAAKFVPIPKREDKRNVEREVEIMNSLQHHLIIQLYAAYEYQKMMCVVLELVEGGELFDRVVEDEFILTERVCVVFIRQVVEAMEFIHRNNILHLDLKPENILCLTQEGNRIKIIDFGLARKFDPDKRLQILFGTPEFVAPEVVNFDCISYATDMWSVGVICYVLISGLSPFMGETDIETMANVTIAKYDFEDESFSNVSPECLDFISKLLVKDLSTRMTAAQCLEHKWLQQRAKPPAVISPKPVNVPPPKLKANTPPKSIPAELNNNNTSSSNNKVSDDTACVDEDETTEEDDEDDERSQVSSVAHMDTRVEPTKELDTTKDNLKNFIERWEEHPNSPYVFDVEGNVIAPLSESPYKKQHGADSISSSRVCSPSPCESIATLTDDEDVFFADDEPNSDSPKSLATPVNESREKLFPLATGAATAGTSTNADAGSTTSTPTPTQYAPQHLFNERFDEYSGTTATMQQQRSMKSYLHTFDRRNSDTNYLLGRRSSGERINLADEIRKLSDHLLMLAEINTKLGDEAKKEATSETTGTSSETQNGGADYSQSVESTSTKDAHKATTTTTSRSSANTSSGNRSISSASSSTKRDTNYHDGRNKVSSLSVRLQQSIEETPTLTNGTTRTWSSSTTTSSTTKKSSISSSSGATALSTSPLKAGLSARTKFNISNATPTASSISHAHTETASSRRAKFRINQMSRDVPIGLPDTHQTVNLEEAANTTKDCLLHLLEKYNETKCRNPLSRHQSISVDWHMSDNLEYRSMSSINAFFQRHNNTGGRNVKHIQAQLEEKATGK